MSGSLTSTSSPFADGDGHGDQEILDVGSSPGDDRAAEGACTADELVLAGSFRGEVHRHELAVIQLHPAGEVREDDLLRTGGGSLRMNFSRTGLPCRTTITSGV